MTQIVSAAGGIASDEEVGLPTLLPQGFDNLSFEEPGTTPGSAGSWAVTAAQAAFAVAGFGAPERGVEDYEDGWGNAPYRPDLAPADVAAAPFQAGLGTDPFESYEAGWGNVPYRDDVVSLAAAELGGPGGAEDYEAGWGNVPYQDDVDVVASFAEDYEDGWGNDDGPIDDLAPGDVTTADFTTFVGTLPFESYGEVKFDQLITLADPVTDKLTVPFNTFSGQKVTIVNVGGLPPAGLAEATTYYVRDSVGDDFRLALTPTGPAVDIVDSGSGTNYVRADPDFFWNGVELTF